MASRGRLPALWRTKSLTTGGTEEHGAVKSLSVPSVYSFERASARTMVDKKP